jgi:hypothetical protein
MAIPDFVAQNDSNFVNIRYYTAQDPYFYTVDNRPLQDIETNLKSIRSGGADAARRAAILGSLNLAAVMADLYAAPSFSGASRVMTGLTVSVPSVNVVRIAPGAVYETRQISTSLTDAVMKMALVTKSSDFALTAPVTAGTSIVYTVEGQFIELTSATMTVSQLPYMDSTNTYLPSTLMHGELQLSLNTGTAATTGSQAAPATTPGKFPLYNITLTQGTSNPVIAAHANSPYIKGINVVTRLNIPQGSVAASAFINEMLVLQLGETATGTILVDAVGNLSNLNPYKPLTLKITFSSAAAGGNVAFRVRYAAFASGDLHSVATASTAITTVAAPGTANVMQTATLTLSAIPATAFSGLSSNTWSVNKDKLSILLDRLGADASDTNAGIINIFQVSLIQ